MAATDRTRRVAAVGLALALAAGCSGAGRRQTAPGGVANAASPTSAARPGSTSTSVLAAVTSSIPDPGRLPQTHDLPNPADAVFSAHSQELWAAIVADDPSRALPFFFPRAAYLQLKDVPNSDADFQHRLLAFFLLDIHAAHALLGADAAGAQLIGVEVPPAAAVWILPGAEQNRIPYYRVYGTRLTYTEGGSTRSFGIFSMLSWRGQWYVIHLGPNPRPSNRGMVYQPQG